MCLLAQRVCACGRVSRGARCRAVHRRYIDGPPPLHFVSLVPLAQGDSAFLVSFGCGGFIAAHGVRWSTFVAW